jgi:hypothetical protein
MWSTIAQPSDLHIILPVLCTSVSENKLMYVNHSLFCYHNSVMTTMWWKNICEISGSHSDEYEDGCLLGCCAV